MVGNDGRTMGCLPPVTLAEPWWQRADDLLIALRQRHKLEGHVLRLLRTSTAEPASGTAVSYAVEIVGEAPADLAVTPCDDMRLAEEDSPMRMPWARVGGVAADVDWADRQIAAMGWRRVGPPRQLRTWNLSLLLTLPTDRGTLWLKQVPPFFRHESRVLALVAETGGAVPSVLASDSERGLLLMEDVAGEDMYTPGDDAAVRMVEAMVRLQYRMATQVAQLLSVGAPDWRAAALLSDLKALTSRPEVRRDLEPAEQSSLDQIIGALPGLFDALTACGIDDSLVHGDFHPANHRFDGRTFTLLDWGDSGVGNPLLDMAAFFSYIQARSKERIRTAWIRAWKDFLPNADMERATDLIRPIAALRQALIYQRFLDNIEPSERVYHRRDPARWLRQAVSERPRLSPWLQERP